tara:strand:- start:9225 stop:10238 length:1014 start_codon:yes stop_codon:yes gene_type:complete
MPFKQFGIIALFAFVSLTGTSVAQAEATDPLPSWNDGASKTAIISFVDKVTEQGGPGFVPEPERIATFDNDGTLWTEQPLYFQGLFALDQIRLQAPQHPEWKTTEPFKSVLAGDTEAVMASGMEGLMKILGVSHTNMTAEEFSASVKTWLASSEHPTKKRPYNELVYQPMLELLDYLRASGFKTFIVSGGGIDFMRVFAEEAYGIPPEQVIGSTLDAKFEMRDGIPTIVKTGDLLLNDDKVGKPVGIYRHIGRRPIFAAGNSDGDLQMLQYTTIARGTEDTLPRFGMIVHHTDADREWAYDRESHIGQLDKGIEEANQRNWTLVDMKADWKTVYPGE